MGTNMFKKMDKMRTLREEAVVMERFDVTYGIQSAQGHERSSERSAHRSQQKEGERLILNRGISFMKTLFFFEKPENYLKIGILLCVFTDCNYCDRVRGVQI